jgi:hypothetical protein
VRLTFALLLIATTAQAAPVKDVDADGYRNCGLHRLEACQNTNQLFFGPEKKGGKHTRKTEFSQALRWFLAGAPKTYIGAQSFNTADSAENEFVGPDGAPERLAAGEWLFRGFEPHASPFSGYVLFDAKGRIELAATLGTETDVATSQSGSADYILRIYSHGAESRSDILDKLKGWAKDAVGNESKYPSALPPNRFAGVELFIEQNNFWSSHWVP